MVLAVLSVAFAAVCIWLVVRAVNRRERWAKWAIVFVVTTVAAYPLSFGIACRSAGRGLLPDSLLARVCQPSDSLLARVYQPCLDMAVDAPAPIRAPLRWWVTFCDGDVGLIILYMDGLSTRPLTVELETRLNSWPPTFLRPAYTRENEDDGDSVSAAAPQLRDSNVMHLGLPLVLNRLGAARMAAFHPSVPLAGALVHLGSRGVGVLREC
jgi:hypothetical protein